MRHFVPYAIMVGVMILNMTIVQRDHRRLNDELIVLQRQCQGAIYAHATR